MQMVIPTYLEQSMAAFTAQQEQMREQLSRTFGDNPMARNMQIPMQMVEDQVRRNTEMFQQAMRMFSPFGHNTAPSAGTTANSQAGTKKADAKDLDELKEQLRALQTKLETLSR
jgi:polyhydroxyalkanoate synthesis regulator protein